MKTDLRIKNMVCDRCIWVVGQELQQLELYPESVSLGRVVIPKVLSNQETENLATRLQALGFELIQDKRTKTVEEIKTLLIELIHYQDERLNIKLSDFLSTQMNTDYSQLSAVFSTETGTTIEKYFILQKIERVKELLTYQEWTLSEIAYKLHYSSVAHLSSQFKKTTGLSPTQYRQEQTDQRKALDQIL